MRWLLLVALLALPISATAQPACWPDLTRPIQLRITDGTQKAELGDLVYSASSVGLVYGWACKAADGKWYHVVVAGAWNTFQSDWLAIADALARGTDAARAAAWTKYATATTFDTRLAPDVAAIKARLPVPPPPPPPPPADTGWVVAPTSICSAVDKDPSGKCVFRATYAWDGKVRSWTVSPEKAPIGAVCNPAIGANGFFAYSARTDRVTQCVKK